MPNISSSDNGNSIILEMKVEEEFNKEGRIISRKIYGGHYTSTWNYQYINHITVEKRSDAIWTEKITDHESKTTKLIYPDRSEVQVKYNV
jgi:hypothetical protein